MSDHTTTVTIDRPPADGTRLTFTQHGLVPELECYDVCSDARGFFVQDSLRAPAEHGTKKPENATGQAAPAEKARAAVDALSRTTPITAADLVLERDIDASPTALLDAIDRVDGWWTTDTDLHGDERTVRFGDKWTRFRVSTRPEGRTWEVTAQDTPAFAIPDEWVGSTLTFDVEPAGEGRSRLRFVHHGLLRQQCADMCTPGWERFVSSVAALAETGTGTPWRPAPVTVAEAG